jgi:hypothetical protein
VPTHRRPPKHRRPTRHRVPGNQGRRQPARLTLAVAAATTVIVGAVSAGVAVAAAGPPEDHAARSLAAAAASGVSRQAAAIQAHQQHSQEGTEGHQATPAPGRASTAAASTPAAHASGPTQRRASSAQASQKPGAAKTYLIYDSVLPSALPSGQVIATYATGAKPAQPAELAGRGPVLWIDVEATDPGANVLDVEPGCASPAAIPTWVSERLSAHPGALAIIYTSIDEWPLAQSEVAGLPTAMRAQVRWWIADPTGYAHIVPGSDATQWYWGPSYDVSTATPRFLAALA